MGLSHWKTDLLTAGVLQNLQISLPKKFCLPFSHKMSVRSEATEPKRDLRATPHVGEEEEEGGSDQERLGEGELAVL